MKTPVLDSLFNNVAALQDLEDLSFIHTMKILFLFRQILKKFHQCSINEVILRMLNAKLCLQGCIQNSLQLNGVVYYCKNTPL